MPEKTANTTRTTEIKEVRIARTHSTGRTSCLTWFRGIALSLSLLGSFIYGQCLSMIKIDGNDVIADENHPKSIKLPTWLREGQTLEKGQFVYSISVIEFTVNGSSLDFSQVLSVSSPAQTVPPGKVWKIESIHKDPSIPPAFTPPMSYTVPGTYTFTQPCNGWYKVRVWGGGGGGGGGSGNSYCGGGGSGGAGGYAEANVYLQAGVTYTVVVGAGGTGGSPGGDGGQGGQSKFTDGSTINIVANGGQGGTYDGSDGVCNNNGTGGAGGSASGGQINITGENGGNASTCGIAPGKGGDAPYGGLGGAPGSCIGGTGQAPGGGGGGGFGCSGVPRGGAGAPGAVVISIP